MWDSRRNLAPLLAAFTSRSSRFIVQLVRETHASSSRNGGACAHGIGRRTFDVRQYWWTPPCFPLRDGNRVYLLLLTQWKSNANFFLFGGQKRNILSSWIRAHPHIWHAQFLTLNSHITHRHLETTEREIPERCTRIIFAFTSSSFVDRVNNNNNNNNNNNGALII